MFYNKIRPLTEAEKDEDDEFDLEEPGTEEDTDPEKDEDSDDNDTDPKEDDPEKDPEEPDTEDENPEEPGEGGSETDDELGLDTQDGGNLDENDEKIAENPLKVRNLYSEYKLLYKGISNAIERLGKFSPSTPIEANLFSYILESLNELREKLYFYMTELYLTKPYNDNLVVFFSYQANLASTKELVKRLAILDEEHQNS